MKQREKDEEVVAKITTQTSSEHDSNRVESATLQSIPMRWLTSLFGCWHKKMNPPYATKRSGPDGRVWRSPKGTRWTRSQGHTRPSNARQRRGAWSSRPNAD